MWLHWIRLDPSDKFSVLKVTSSLPYDFHIHTRFQCRYTHFPTQSQTLCFPLFRVLESVRGNYAKTCGTECVRFRSLTLSQVKENFSFAGICFDLIQVVISMKWRKFHRQTIQTLCLATSISRWMLIFWLNFDSKSVTFLKTMSKFFWRVPNYVREFPVKCNLPMPRVCLNFTGTAVKHFNRNVNLITRKMLGANCFVEKSYCRRIVERWMKINDFANRTPKCCCSVRPSEQPTCQQTTTEENFLDFELN